VSTAAKHGLNTMAVLRDALASQPALDSATTRTRLTPRFARDITESIRRSVITHAIRHVRPTG